MKLIEQKVTNFLGADIVWLREKELRDVHKFLTIFNQTAYDWLVPSKL